MIFERLIEGLYKQWNFNIEQNKETNFQWKYKINARNTRRKKNQLPAKLEGGWKQKGNVHRKRQAVFCNEHESQSNHLGLLSRGEQQEPFSNPLKWLFCGPLSRLKARTGRDNRHSQICPADWTPDSHSLRGFSKRPRHRGQVEPDWRLCQNRTNSRICPSVHVKRIYK